MWLASVLWKRAIQSRGFVMLVLGPLFLVRKPIAVVLALLACLLNLHNGGNSLSFAEGAAAGMILIAAFCL